MRGLDLFAGIGGASLAMQSAGIEVVAHAEIEPFPSAVLECRFPGVPNLGDVSKITDAQIDALGQIDVVSFGSPCQDWSVAGKRLGLKGHRSSLFHEAIRIIRLCRPRFALFENVPGLFSAAGGWDFAAVLDEMAESGALDIAWRVLDAQWFGVPQRRRRIFLVADFRGERAGEILSIEEGVFRHPAPGREAGKEAARGSGDGTQEPSVIKGAAIGREPENGPQYGEILEDGTTYTLNCTEVHAVAGTLGGGTGQRGWADDTDRMTFVPEVSFVFNANERWDGESETFLPICFSSQDNGRDATLDRAPTLRVGTGLDIPSPPAVAFTERTRADGRSVESQEDIAYSLNNPGAGGRTQENRVAAGMAVRRLTPTECERLQGFPDGWTDIPDASDSGRYRALGNAWAIPCGEWIMQRVRSVT